MHVRTDVRARAVREHSVPSSDEIALLATVLAKCASHARTCERSPGADAAGVSPVPAQMWPG